MASSDLLIDIDTIQAIAWQEAPKWMEWYSGFSLLLTLIWMYISSERRLPRSSAPVKNGNYSNYESDVYSYGYNSNDECDRNDYRVNCSRDDNAYSDGRNDYEDIDGRNDYEDSDGGDGDDDNDCSSDSDSSGGDSD